MRIVMTGARGFIGQNLQVRLREQGHADIVTLTYDADDAAMVAAVTGADVVFHLAGVNRPKDDSGFVDGNTDFTRRIVGALTSAGAVPAIVYASSTQAALDNAYGRSKRAAEDALLAFGEAHGSPIHLVRLTNVFGKWSRPHYNSAVATFCHQVARDLPIAVNDPAAPLRLIYIDDVITAFLELLAARPETRGFVDAGPVHETTVGVLADTIRSFAVSRSTLVTPPVGTGFVRALYATYVSFLPPTSFEYTVARHEDPRGVFVEMLKTPDAGQFSYFTAWPGITRGEHYHHTKTEKFLVIKGKAHFGFRQIETGERHELVVTGGEARIVETIPGWTHNITNVGDDELIVMLWANEIFDRARPDTIAMKVNP
jgi:UDP-2-acetamido-2,6-beta-L-arabino-hexul-4-ose reductase